MLTLAGLRRRGTPRRIAVEQADLFAPLIDSGMERANASPQLENEQVPEFHSASDRNLTSGPTVQSESVHASPNVTLAPGIASHPLAPELERLPRPDFFEVQQPEPSADPTPRTWTVSALVGHVRGLVERGYGQVSVEGEISNWRPAGSGHCYFTVKDAGAQLSAVLFRRQASLLRFRPTDGSAVRLHGQLSIYESRGQMQIIVEWMEQVGFGALLAEVQRLKERLRREGLFDRKRPLPLFPKCIGIVTSLQGAALRDIIKVCRRRHAAVQLLIYPAAVQGPSCAAEIAAGVRWFSAHPDRAEVVLVARGGGSWEDLHGFDDERIARAIATCSLPVITGIGHAPDSTVADAAADLCAPTPSAAAELLTAAHHRVEERIAQLHARLLRAGSFQILRAGGRLNRLGVATVLRRVQDGLNRRSQRLDELAFRSEAGLRSRLRRTDGRLTVTVAHLGRHNPQQRLRDDHRRLELLQSRLERASSLRRNTVVRRTETAAHRLEALSPLRVLERGYALVYGPEGTLLRNAESIPGGTVIRARLAQGELRARVLSAENTSSSHREPSSGI